MSSVASHPNFESYAFVVMVTAGITALLTSLVWVQYFH